MQRHSIEMGNCMPAVTLSNDVYIKHENVPKTDRIYFKKNELII